MNSDSRELVVLINGRQQLRTLTTVGDAELGMLISKHMPDLEKKGRVVVAVTGPDLIRRIVCRSR
jgi:hypothetical protein